MNIKNAADLKLAITELERESISQKEILMDQLHETYESLKPQNLIRSAITDMTGSERITERILGILPSLAITAATSILPQKILGGTSSKFIKKALRMLIDIGIARTIGKYTHEIKDIGNNFLKGIISKIIQ